MKFLARSLACVLAFVALSCASGLLGARPVVESITYNGAPGDAYDQVELIVTLSDADISICSMTVEVWTAGTGAWNAAAITGSTVGVVAGSGKVTRMPIDTNAAPTQVHVTWDSWTDDIGRAAADGTVKVRVTPADGDGTGDTVESAVFTVNNVIPDMKLSQDAVTLQAGRGDADPWIDVNVINDGAAGPMEWEITDMPAWLSASPTQGDTAAGGGETKVTFTVDTTGLGVGTITDSVTFQDRAGAALPSHGSPLELPITLEIGEPVLEVSAASLSFADTQDAMAVSSFRNPADVTFTVSNTGPTYTNLVWSLALSEAWLSSDVTSGSLPGGQSQTVTLSAEVVAPVVNGLADPVGAPYTDTVTISDTRLINPDETIAVSLPVRWQRPDILVHDNGTPTPTEVTVIEFQCVASAGLEVPSPQSVWIGNGSAEPNAVLMWSAAITGSSPWLSLAPSGGAVALAQGVSEEVIVSADGTGLSPDTYETTIVVSGWDNSRVPPEPTLTGDKTIIVRLWVKEPASIDLSPTELVFPNGIAYIALPDPAVDTVTLQNFGGLDLDWISSWVGTAPSWLSCPQIPSSGTVAPGGVDSQAFTFTVTSGALSLPQGDYVATVRIQDAGTPTTYSDFTVTLHVGTRDLRITSITHSPTTPEEGESVTFTVTVANNGDVAAGPFSVGFWSSRTSTPTATTTPESTATVLSLGASSTTTRAFTVSAPTAGTRYAYAYADTGAGGGAVEETNESNNASSSHYWRTVAGPDGDNYEDDDMFSQATTITNGGTQTHTLHEYYDYDYVKFYVASTATLNIYTNGTSGDTVITLYGPSYNYLTEDDDSGLGLFSQITYFSATPGWYYVRVRGFGGSTILPPDYYNITVTWY